MGALRAGLQSAVGALGYEISKKRSLSELPEKLPDAACYSAALDKSLLYQPWLQPEFGKVMRPEIRGTTMLSPLKLYFLKSFVEQCLGVQGDFFEAGTASGGSSLLILDLLRKRSMGKHLWTLDTFEGYQGVDVERDGTHVNDGELRCAGADEVKRLLGEGAKDVTVVVGRIPGTLSQVMSTTLAFAHIDVNLAEPTLSATRFCLERLSVGGIILFDDYGWPKTYGARRAIDEACTEAGQVPISIPASTQAFLIRK